MTFLLSNAINILRLWFLSRTTLDCIASKPKRNKSVKWTCGLSREHKSTYQAKPGKIYVLDTAYIYFVCFSYEVPPFSHAHAFYLHVHTFRLPRRGFETEWSVERAHTQTHRLLSGKWKRRKEKIKKSAFIGSGVESNKNICVFLVGWFRERDRALTLSSAWMHRLTERRERVEKPTRTKKNINKLLPKMLIRWQIQCLTPRETLLSLTHSRWNWSGAIVWMLCVVVERTCKPS